MNLSIPTKAIISSTDIKRNLKKVDACIEENGTCFIFKNNNPERVLMSIDEYTKLMDYIKKLEQKK